MRDNLIDPPAPTKEELAQRYFSCMSTKRKLENQLNRLERSYEKATTADMRSQIMEKICTVNEELGSVEYDLEEISGEATFNYTKGKSREAILNRKAGVKK